MEKNTHFGIPLEVALYHPIEFLELKKTTQAFLNISLEDVKGGVKSQLLVGHLIQYVQNKGMDSFKLFLRFREEYVTDMIDQCTAKGIDLLHIPKNSFSLNTSKMTILSDSVSIYQSEDLFDRAANIYSSSNYSMFHRLKFNRTTSKKHVNELVALMKNHGVITYPLIVYTDCIDGEWKYWIIDGQHRIEAFKKLGLPVWFTLYQKQGDEPINLYDIVELIASVNNSSRRWNLHQFLRTWKSVGVEDYQVIDAVYKQTKIAINILLQAYSGFSRKKATDMFTSGKYRMHDRAKGELYVSYIKELKSIIPKSTAYQSALLDLFRMTPGYNNMYFKDKLIAIKGSYDFGETQELILENLQKVYLEAA